MVSRARTWGSLLIILTAASVQAEEPMWIDARAAVTVQAFQQALLPGLPGMVGQQELALPVTTTAFLRAGGIDLPGAPDSVSGEVSAWGRLGPRDAVMGDGDVTAAWAQYQRGLVRVRLGRQVSLPGSARYVRFDGATVGLKLGVLDLDAYGGFVALPRWNRPRGAWVLGFVGDALKDTQLLEAQSRAGQLTAGARLGVGLGRWGSTAVAFHEQRDAVGVAFRVVSADLALKPTSWLAAGARATLDTRALAVSEARAWLDVTGWRDGAAALDYSYQSPSLLLPQTSVLAAFGGAAWHELGAEATVRLPFSLALTMRGAGQLFEGDRLGGRGTVRAKWTPGLDGRWLLLAEVQRLLVVPQGFTQLRLGARFRASEQVTTTLDGALFVYDAPVRGVTVSATGVGSVEWAARPWLRLLASATVLNSPFASFELQGLGRFVVDLDPASSGGLL